MVFQAYSLELALYKLTTENGGGEASHEMRIIETNLRVKYYNHSQVGFPGVLQLSMKGFTYAQKKPLLKQVSTPSLGVGGAV